MKEWYLRKGTEQGSLWEICSGETGGLLYRLCLDKEKLWSRNYRVVDREDRTAGALNWQHEAFALAKMPRVTGVLEGREVFVVKRQLESLQDKVEVEGEQLQLEGDILQGSFRLIWQGQPVARFRYTQQEKKLWVEGRESLAALFALALACL